MTSSLCASQFDIQTMKDVVVARMGGFRNQFSLSAHDQLRNVVYSMNIPKTTISMLLFEEPVTLNEHVNVVCIPSITW